jgi:hypothetical protein
MTTLIVKLEERQFHISLYAIQPSPQGKDIVLRASSHQPDLEEGELTELLFDLDEAALSITGDGQALAQAAVAQGLSFTLILDNGHSVEIDSEQFR